MHSKTKLPNVLKGIRTMKFDANRSTNMLHLSMPFIYIFILCGFIRAPILAPLLLFWFIIFQRMHKKYCLQ